MESIFVEQAGVLGVLSAVGGSQAVFSTLDHNLHWNNADGPCQNVTIGSNWVTANPLFINSFNDHFQLQTGSPAIDKGVDIFDIDCNGSAPLNDNGAYPDMGYWESP